MPRHETSLLQRIITCCCPSAVEGTDAPTEAFLASVQGQHPEMTPLPGPAPVACAATPLSVPAPDPAAARYADAQMAPEVISLPVAAAAGSPTLPPPLCADAAPTSRSTWPEPSAAAAGSSSSAAAASPSEPRDVPSKPDANLFPAAGSKTASTLDSSPVVGSLEMYNNMIGLARHDSRDDLADKYDGELNTETCPICCSDIILGPQEAIIAMQLPCA